MSSHDTDDTDDAGDRWAFGSGGDASPTEVTAPPPAGVDAADVATVFERLDLGDAAILQAVLRFPAAPEAS